MKTRRLAFAVLVVTALGAAGWVSVDFAQSVGLSPGYQPPQPIAFSHELHAGERQIACLYCHYGAERSRHAGIPSLSVCMGCHEEIDKPSLELAKLADAVERDRPIRWIQVHKLPDFVYFNHRQHVGAGVECQSCHGPVETMEVVRQEAPLNMGWCLDCHRQRNATEFSREPHAGVAEITEASEGASISAIGGMDCAKCHY